ncbi:hypothetical protein BHE74_00018167, partial [Ensete ventricosum]
LGPKEAKRKLFFSFRSHRRRRPPSSRNLRGPIVHRLRVSCPTSGRRAGRFDAAGTPSRSRRNCHRKMNGTSAEDGVRQAPSMQPPPQLEWKFSQVFGERMVGEEVQEGAIFAPRY